MSKTIQTRKNEQRITTLEPKELLNKFLTSNLCRTWNEDFKDEDTGQIVTVERSEIILQKGTCLTSDNMQTVLFHIHCGDITEPIEVSDQSRQAVETSYMSQRPFAATVVLNDAENVKLLLEASEINQALEIVRDYCELNYSGRFLVREMKRYDPAIILVDRLRRLPADEAAQRYVQGEIPFEEFMDEVTDDLELEAHKADPEMSEEHIDNCKFYQIKAAIYRNGDRDQDTELFLVLASDADRAILTINAWLQAKQKKYNEDRIKMMEHDEIDHDTLTATIEESKIVKFTQLVPRKFCLAYAED